MKLKIIVIVTILTLPLSIVQTLAQGLFGRILAEKEKGIPHAIVSVYEKGALVNFTISDSLGNYTLQGRHSDTCSIVIGYNNKADTFYINYMNLEISGYLQEPVYISFVMETHKILLRSFIISCPVHQTFYSDPPGIRTFYSDEIYETIH